MTKFIEVSHPPQFHQFRAGLLALRKKATTGREGIPQQNEELEGMRAVCAKSAAKQACVGEQRGSLIIQLECMLERWGTPTQTCIDEASSTSKLPLWCCSYMLI